MEECFDVSFSLWRGLLLSCCPRRTLSSPLSSLPSLSPRRVLADTRIRGVGGKPIRRLEIGAFFVVFSDVRKRRNASAPRTFHAVTRYSSKVVFQRTCTSCKAWVVWSWDGSDSDDGKTNFSTTSATQRLPCRHMTLTRTSNLTISEDTSSEEYGGRRVTSMKFIV